MGIKMSPKQFLSVCDGSVKYDEAKVDRILAILKTNNSGSGGGGGGGPCGIQ